MALILRLERQLHLWASSAAVVGRYTGSAYGCPNWAVRHQQQRNLSTAVQQERAAGPPPAADDGFIALEGVRQAPRRARSHALVDISDHTEDVSASVLTQQEFLAAKKTRFVTREEYENLKPHEVRKHLAATMRPEDLVDKYGKKRAKKIIQRRELAEHAKVTWNPRDRVAETHIKEFTADDIDVDRRPRVERFHFVNKSIYDMTESEFYSSFFRDRDRRFDGMGTKLRSLEAQIIKDRQAQLGLTERKRVAPKEYWIKPRYVTPEVHEVAALNAMDLRFVMMNEARRAIAEACIDAAVWEAFLSRVRELAPKVTVRSLLRYLQIVAKVQLTPTEHVRALVDQIHRRRAELKPKHYVFLFQALGRLRLRDQRLYDDAYEMLLCWSVLRNNFVIKAANALAKLGVGDTILLQPLRQVLEKRIDHFSATDCVRTKAITALELFTDEMLVAFLHKCEYHRQHFRHYSRNLEIVELYLRIVKRDVYARLEEATKQFLVDARQNAVDKKLAQLGAGDRGGALASVRDDDGVQENRAAGEQRQQAAEAITCEYHRDVSRVLDAMRIKHRNFMQAGKMSQPTTKAMMGTGPFVLDIYEPLSNTVIEVNSEHQYYHGTTKLTASARR